MEKKVVLEGACRTAIGKMGGALSNTPAADLGAIVIKEALRRLTQCPKYTNRNLSSVCDKHFFELLYFHNHNPSSKTAIFFTQKLYKFQNK